MTNLSLTDATILKLHVWVHCPGSCWLFVVGSAVVLVFYLSCLLWVQSPPLGCCWFLLWIFGLFDPSTAPPWTLLSSLDPLACSLPSSGNCSFCSVACPSSGLPAWARGLKIHQWISSLPFVISVAGWIFLPLGLLILRLCWTSVLNLAGLFSLRSASLWNLVSTAPVSFRWKTAHLLCLSASWIGLPLWSLVLALCIGLIVCGKVDFGVVLHFVVTLTSLLWRPSLCLILSGLFSVLLEFLVPSGFNLGRRSITSWACLALELILIARTLSWLGSPLSLSWICSVQEAT